MLACVASTAAKRKSEAVQRWTKSYGDSMRKIRTNVTASFLWQRLYCADLQRQRRHVLRHQLNIGWADYVLNVDSGIDEHDVWRIKKDHSYCAETKSLDFMVIELSATK